ncbi:hypothetical protein FRB90_000953 [Tulasnella sp. 427]|nr:hypothetical protein FRB90_000953 [Tulasnella sp. 427]
MIMTAQSIDHARQRYSQELAQHTKMQWDLARSQQAQRRQQETSPLSDATSKGRSSSSNGGSQEAQDHAPTSPVSPTTSSASHPNPRSGLKVIDFADPDERM